MKWCRYFLLGLLLFPGSAVPQPSHATHAAHVDACYMPGEDAPPLQLAFVISAAKWDQPDGLGSPITITYSYSNLLDGGISGLTPEQLVTAVEEALSLWSACAPLSFVEMPDLGPLPSGQFDTSYDGTTSPIIRFGHHPIDGQGSVAAHAYYPTPATFGLAGDVHFDEAENWGRNSGGLFLEACLHEIGHTLGLAHSPLPSQGGVDAIMNAVLKNRFVGIIDGYLLPDDVAGIRAIYGEGVGSVLPIDVRPVPGPIAPVGLTIATPTFEWSDVPGALNYHFQLQSDSTGEIVVDEPDLLVNAVTPGLALNYSEVYYWRVRANFIDGWSDWSEVIAIQIEDAPPPDPPESDIPTPLSPLDFASVTPTFEWTDVGAVDYHFKLEAVSPRQTVYLDRHFPGTQVTPDIVLVPGGIYRWMVRGYFTDGFGPWSDYVYFQVDGEAPSDPPPPQEDPDIPTPLSPLEFASVTPTFEWTDVGAVDYHFKLETVSPRQTVYLDRHFPGTQVTPDIVLVPGVSYRWMVRGYFADGFGPWSDYAYFQAEGEAPSDPPPPQQQPDIPTPLSPLEFASVTPTFEWTDVGAVDYHIKLESISPRETVYLDRHFPGTHVTPDIVLVPGASYRWMVRGYFTDGFGPWSDYFTFIVEP